MKKFSKSLLLLTLMGASAAGYAIELRRNYQWHQTFQQVEDITANSVADVNTQIRQFNDRFCKQGLYDGKPNNIYDNSFCRSAPTKISSNKFRYTVWNWQSY